MGRQSAIVAMLVSACLPAEVLKVQQSSLGDGFVFLEGGGGNTVVVTGGRTVLVFDTKQWPGDSDVVRVVEEARPDRVIVVNSHAHIDHTGGNRLFPDALIIAAPDVLAELGENAPQVEIPTPAIPTVPVVKELRLEIGGEPVVLVHPDPAHTSGDVFAWFPRTRLLVTGDVFDHGFYPHVDAARGGSYVGMIAALEQLVTYPATVVVPGHGPKATISDIAANLRFLREIRDGVASRRAQGMADEAIFAQLASATGEPLQNLGFFSSREKVVRGFLRELPPK